MKRSILNDISKALLLIIVVILAGIIIYDKYIRNLPMITTTELIIQYKGCIVVDKKDSKRENVYNLTIRNPYTSKDTEIKVLSGLYFNYYIGDTIGTRKQKFHY